MSIYFFKCHTYFHFKGTNVSLHKDVSGNVDWESNATRSPAKEMNIINESSGPFDESVLFPPMVQSSSEHIFSDGTHSPERLSRTVNDRVSQGAETSKVGYLQFFNYVRVSSHFIFAIDIIQKLALACQYDIKLTHMQCLKVLSFTDCLAYNDS